MKVSVLGVMQTVKFLTAKSILINQKVYEGLAQAGRLLQNEVKLSVSGHRSEKTSVDTGQFLNSIDMVRSGFEVMVFTPLEYPKHLEYGTSKIKARRHFNNSLDRNRSKIKELIAFEIQTELTWAWEHL